MHMRGVARDQHTSLAVGGRLPRGIGEPGNQGGRVGPVVGPVDSDERCAEIAEGGFGGLSEALFSHQDADRSVIRVDDLAIADFVIHRGEGMDAEGVAADAQCRRRLGELDLGDQVAGGGIRSRERDAGGFAKQAASAIAPDEILRPQRAAVAQFDINAGVVLRETRHLNAAINRRLELVDPAGEDPLDVLLPQAKPVRAPGGKFADIQLSPRECRDLSLLPFREKSLSDAALI
jgi:hypothetical protein